MTNRGDQRSLVWGRSFCFVYLCSLGGGFGLFCALFFSVEFDLRVLGVFEVSS